MRRIGPRVNRTMEPTQPHEFASLPEEQVPPDPEPAPDLPDPDPVYEGPPVDEPKSESDKAPLRRKAVESFKRSSLEEKRRIYEENRRRQEDERKKQEAGKRMSKAEETKLLYGACFNLATIG